MDYFSCYNFWQAVNFDLHVFHPRDCLYALYVDYKKVMDDHLLISTACDATPPTQTQAAAHITDLRRIWKKDAEQVLRGLETTSALLTHSPAEIAAGCLLITEPAALKGTLEHFLTHRYLLPTYLLSLVRVRLNQSVVGLARIFQRPQPAPLIQYLLSSIPSIIVP